MYGLFKENKTFVSTFNTLMFNVLQSNIPSKLNNEFVRQFDSRTFSCDASKMAENSHNIWMEMEENLIVGRIKGKRVERIRILHLEFMFF